MSGGSERFRRSQRLRSSKDFRRISREGRRLVSRSFIILLVDEPVSGHPARLGVTVSRRVGGAVARNRIKRRIREWFRRQGAGLRGEVVVIARPAAASLGAKETARELTALLGAEARS